MAKSIRPPSTGLGGIQFPKQKYWGHWSQRTRKNITWRWSMGDLFFYSHCNETLDTIQYSYNTIQCNMVTIQCNACITTLHNPIQCKTVTIQHNKIQLQCNTIQYNPTQYMYSYNATRYNYNTIQPKQSNSMQNSYN